MACLFRDFQWASGVEPRILGTLDADNPLEQQMDEVHEDMVQVKYSDRVLLDVGWYGEYGDGGRFAVVVIVDYEWDEPHLRLETTSLVELSELIGLAQDAALAKRREKGARIMSEFEQPEAGSLIQSFKRAWALRKSLGDVPLWRIRGVFSSWMPGFFSPLDYIVSNEIRLRANRWAPSAGFTAFGITMLGTAVYMGTFPSTPGKWTMPMVLGGVGIIASLMGIHSYSKTFEVTLNLRDLKVRATRKSITGARVCQCTFEDLTVWKHKLRIMSRKDWNEWCAVLITPLGAFPLAVTKEESELDDYLNGLPEILRNRAQGEG